MFFFALTNLSEKEVKNRWRLARDKWETKKLLFHNFGSIGLARLDDAHKTHTFLSHIDNFLEKHFDNASIPLLTAIAMWTNYRLKQNAKKIGSSQ